MLQPSDNFNAEGLSETQTEVTCNSIDGLIHRWLHERQELILFMCAVDGLKEFTPQDTPLSVKVQAFCQILIDYVSAGHFEIYEKLFAQADETSDQNYADILNSIYPRLQVTTEAAIHFNDKYGTPQHEQTLLQSLSADMSRLGEQLEERFELEDRLIDTFHHQQPAASLN